MSDMPLQGLLQQLKAHRHSGEHLEVLGKHAAAAWGNGQYKTLTVAVTETVKQAQLSPEQVQRVVEFANTAAYLEEFKKEGTSHKVIDFPGGPADTSEILKDLNDGGGGSVYDRGTGDYDAPPSDQKVASAQVEEALYSLLNKTVAQEEPYENPHGEVIDLRDKLAGAEAQLHSDICGLEVMYADLADRAYFQVKQAALSGVSLGAVMQAWQAVAPSEDHIKVAFTLMTPRLLRDEVFHGVDTMMASVDKTAEVHAVNTEHPLVTEFEEFCTVLSKLAETREAHQDIRKHLTHLTTYLKTAALAGDAYRAAARGSEAAANTVAPLVGRTLGEGAGKATHAVVRNAHNIAAGLGAMEAHTHLMHSQNPVARAARGTGHLVARNIPGTEAHLRHQYEVESGQ